MKGIEMNWKTVGVVAVVTLFATSGFGLVAGGAYRLWSQREQTPQAQIPVQPQLTSPAITVQPPPEGEANLMWAVLQCTAGFKPACGPAANIAAAIEKGGKEVRLCAMIGKSAQCLDVEIVEP